MLLCIMEICVFLIAMAIDFFAIEVKFMFKDDLMLF